MMEKLCSGLEDLREKKFYASVFARLNEGANHVSLEDAFGEGEYRDFLAIDPDVVSDEGLFET